MRRKLPSWTLHRDRARQRERRGNPARSARQPFSCSCHPSLLFVVVSEGLVAGVTVNNMIFPVILAGLMVLLTGINATSTFVDTLPRCWQRCIDENKEASCESAKCEREFAAPTVRHTNVFIN